MVESLSRELLENEIMSGVGIEAVLSAYIFLLCSLTSLYGGIR